MKIIELLNKIANGEEVPKKIKFYGKYYIWYDNEYTGNEGYCLEPLKADSNSFLEINTLYDLNKEVEIIEEDKKIEDKARFQYSQIPNWFKGKELINTINANFERHQKAIYEIIDYINNKD